MWISLDSYIKAGLKTLRCEKGLEQVEEVNFDQIKTTLLWRSGINDGTTQFWREIDCVMVENLMSGTCYHSGFP